MTAKQIFQRKKAIGVRWKKKFLNALRIKTSRQRFVNLILVSIFISVSSSSRLKTEGLRMDSNPHHLSNGTKKEAELEMESVKSGLKPLVVSILGTGEFGRALGRKIFESCSRSAIRIVFGSRNPTRGEIRFLGQDQPVETFSHEDAILKSGKIWWLHNRDLSHYRVD